MMDLNGINFYLTKSVLVTLTDGRRILGELDDVLPESDTLVLKDAWVLVSEEMALSLPETPEMEEAEFPLSQVADVEMVGELDYHTYATDSSKVCDIIAEKTGEKLEFGMDAFAPGVDLSKLAFGEFRCMAACHLEYQGKFCAKDVRILSFSHKIYESALKESAYLYVRRGKDAVVGKLEILRTGEKRVVQDDCAETVDFTEVADIIRMPRMNETVTVTLQNGEEISGTVAGADESKIGVISSDGRYWVVKVKQILTIRYTGTIRIGIQKLPGRSVKQVKLYLETTDEAFLCKLPYFRSPEDELLAVDGVVASFIPGMSEKGLIAKDVVVDAKETMAAEESKVGVIMVAPTLNRPMGYIGETFCTKTYNIVTRNSMPRGTVSFTADQLSFDMEMHMVYVVRYTYTMQEPTARARKIELLETYSSLDYAKIWVDKEGNVHKLPVSLLFLNKFLHNTVEIRRDDDTSVVGILEAYDGEELVVAVGETGKVVIKSEEVIAVYCRGVVTAYPINQGTGVINGEFWFHVNDFNDRSQVQHLDVGSSVKFTFKASNKGNGCAAAELELVEDVEKKGYIIKYVPREQGTGFGFIIPPEDLEDCLRTGIKRGSIYFAESAIENPGTFDLDTNKCYYLVSYMEKREKTGKTIAFNVGLLEEHRFPGRTVAEPPREIPAPQPVEKAPLQEVTDDAPDFRLGESVYLKFKDGSVSTGLYSGEDNDAYVLLGGATAKKAEIDTLFRFGVITALDLENGTATINNSFDFSLSVAESKMVSILKNQKNLVRLHVMYSCEDRKITEVCRVSKHCLGSLTWESGIVTDVDTKVRCIKINDMTTHYLTVSSEGINSYVNNETILNREVFAKQVFHPYRESGKAEPEVVAMAVDVRCQEEELTIRYDEGKDVYQGYRNSTVSFPVFGSAKVLSELVGETIPVSFRVSASGSALEAYVDDGGMEDNEEQSDNDGMNKIQQEALSLLLIQREEPEKLLIGKSTLDEEGKLSDQGQVQWAVDHLISKAKHLAAVRLAMEYPELELSIDTENLLRSEIRSRSTAIGLDANSCYGEQAFYLTTALQYPYRSKGKSSGGRFSSYDFLYRLFAQDFESREHLVKYVQAGIPANKATLVSLFRKPCGQIGELIAHMVLLNRYNLNVVCSAIRLNRQLSENIMAYAREIDDMISGEDVTEVILAVQERYLRDKRRFTERMLAQIGNENICENLKNLLISMRERFLKLMCRDDSLRFERLQKICADVLDYTNKPGFTQQEQLLQHAYREVTILEEDILSHPCKESVEILLSSGQFDLTANVLASVKASIYGELNGLYQGASKPRIYCKVNEISLRPGAKTFWLIVGNGGQKENLQTAENLRIELESFTEGFAPQTQVQLTRNRLACGDQLAVEVAFELAEDTTGVLEFGWEVSYEYITEFQSNGSTRKSVIRQSSEAPLQLQIETASAFEKNYDAQNPYYGPAEGQPLESKEMFFGRKTEMAKVMECICTDDGEKNFIPGSSVIIHGQKKSGKTSLVNQIKNYIKEDVILSDKAIFLNFSNVLTDIGGVQQLDCFQRTFYTSIMSKFRMEIKRHHPDVVAMLKENDLSAPNLLSKEYAGTWPVAFDAFFREFYAIDKGKHSIILFMDEFTVLCTTILAEVERSPEKESLRNIPNFIKTFSQYGFIQVIIGHESMMRALDTLGVLNHTAEFAKSVEISALDEEASRELIKKPMADKFGYDVYDSELGLQAVERLLDLSGRNPTYLMRLCNRMFQYYTDREKCPGTQLLISDVNAMVQEYTGELLLSDFDILLREDGDDTMEVEKRKTYHYLKCAALLSLTSYDKRTADSSEITRELQREYGHTVDQIEKTRNILEARRVISITNGGRVKINTALFSEYIQQKNGLW